MAELKRFEYIIEFEPYALQNKDELCFKSRNTIRLVRCKDSFDNSTLHLGYIKFAEAEIRINESASAEMQKQTLFHEMLHGMLVLIGRTEEGNDEQFVQSLSLAMFNSFDIKEGE